MEKQRENQIEQDELFRFWFAGLKGIGNREKIQLTKEFPQKNTLYYIEETALKKRLKEKWTEEKAETITQIIQEGKRRWSKEIVAEWQKKGIALVTYEQEKYPDRLRNISSPPYALYVMGKLPEKGRRTAAIVGARNCTYYGETYARKIGKILSEAGISVLSGWQEESTQQVKEGQSTEAEEHLVFLEAVWIFAIQKRIEDSMKI